MSEDKASGDKKTTGRVHPISIDALIVHKYSASNALLQKADKRAREILAEELREGEFYKAVKPGRYHLHLPKLMPEAGQLRASVIADRIYREIRQLNPTALQISNEESALDPAPVKLGSAKQAAVVPRKVPAETDEEAEMRKLASQAVMMMASDAVVTEELVSSDLGRFLQAEIDIRRVPVWNIKNGLISAHECTPMMRNAGARETISMQGKDPVEIRAVIDMIVYKAVGSILKKNLEQQQPILLICPVHTSTLESSRYTAAYLGCGADIAPAAQRSLVFLVKGVKAPVSRLKLRDLVRYLRTRARGLILETPINVEEVALFKEFGFHGIRASASGMPEKRFLKDVNVFAEKCEKAKLESFAGDVRTKSAAIGALASGCTYLAGSLIAKRSSGMVEEFRLDSLFETRS
jgi:hypothetical protein